MLLDGGVKRGEAEHGAIRGGELAEGDRGFGVAYGHDDRPRAQGAGGDDAFEVGVGEGFPPDIDTGGGEGPDGGIDVLSFVIEREVGAEAAAGFDFLV